MGCDIHMVLEYHDDHNDVWVGLHNYSLPPDEALQEQSLAYVGFKVTRRNYDLFANLAGVRVYNDGTYPEPRGIPPDAASLTLYRFAQWENDAHSASWVSLKEFTLIYAREVKGNLNELVVERLEGADEDKPHTWALYREVSGEYISAGDNVDKYRIVFWFDN